VNTFTRHVYDFNGAFHLIFSFDARTTEPHVQEALVVLALFLHNRGRFMAGMYKYLNFTSIHKALITVLANYDTKRLLTKEMFEAYAKLLDRQFILEGPVRKASGSMALAALHETDSAQEINMDQDFLPLVPVRVMTPTLDQLARMTEIVSVKPQTSGPQLDQAAPQRLPKRAAGKFSMAEMTRMLQTNQPNVVPQTTETTGNEEYAYEVAKFKDYLNHKISPPTKGNWLQLLKQGDTLGAVSAATELSKSHVQQAKTQNATVTPFVSCSMLVEGESASVLCILCTYGVTPVDADGVPLKIVYTSGYLDVYAEQLGDSSIAQISEAYKKSMRLVKPTGDRVSLVFLEDHESQPYSLAMVTGPSLGMAAFASLTGMPFSKTSNAVYTGGFPTQGAAAPVIEELGLKIIGAKVFGLRLIAVISEFDAQVTQLQNAKVFIDLLITQGVTPALRWVTSVLDLIDGSNYDVALCKCLDNVFTIFPLPYVLKKNLTEEDKVKQYYSNLRSQRELADLPTEFFDEATEKFMANLSKEQIIPDNGPAEPGKILVFTPNNIGGERPVKDIEDAFDDPNSTHYVTYKNSTGLGTVRDLWNAAARSTNNNVVQTATKISRILGNYARPESAKGRPPSVANSSLKNLYVQYANSNKKSLTMSGKFRNLPAQTGPPKESKFQMPTPGDWARAFQMGATAMKQEGDILTE
jgi:hypothetical protein